MEGTLGENENYGKILDEFEECSDNALMIKSGRNSISQGILSNILLANFLSFSGRSQIRAEAVP